MSKTKYSSATTAVGPLIRLFDAHFSLDDVRHCEVSVHVPADLGTLINRVRTSDWAPPWRFGVRALMAKLVDRNLTRPAVSPSACA